MALSMKAMKAVPKYDTRYDIMINRDFREGEAEKIVRAISSISCIEKERIRITKDAVICRSSIVTDAKDDIIKNVFQELNICPDVFKYPFDFRLEDGE